VNHLSAELDAGATFSVRTGGVSSVESYRVADSVIGRTSTQEKAMILSDNCIQNDDTETISWERN